MMISTANLKFMFIEGFLIFADPIQKTLVNNRINFFDLQIFLTTADKEILFKRRRKREVAKNEELPEDYYEQVLWPEYLENHSFILDNIIPQKQKTQKQNSSSSGCSNSVDIYPNFWVFNCDGTPMDMFTRLEERLLQSL